METKETKLNLSQERFCQLYATHKDFFGNGVDSYAEAYDVDQTKPNWYMAAAASASRLLKSVKVIDRINEILEKTGFNDAFVDKQLSFMVAQHADLGSKLGAIKEYNKLKQRIVSKTDITSDGKPITIQISEAVAKKNE